MDNKLLNKILIILILVMSVIIGIMINLIIKNEAARNYYSENDIVNYTWKNAYEGSSMILENNILNLEINNISIYKDTKAKLNTMTGEIMINNKSTNELYVRSVSDNQIVIWYKEAEYRMNKIVIAR